MNDCIKAIELDQRNMKAYYYLAQAQLALKRPNEAFCSAMTAYEKCVETQDKSISNVSALVLGTKKQKWLAKERERQRNRSNLLKELEDGLLKNKKAELGEMKFRTLDSVEAKEERADIERAYELKVEELYSTFALADPQHMPKRVSSCSHVCWYVRTPADTIARRCQITSSTASPSPSCMTPSQPRLATHMIAPLL